MITRLLLTLSFCYLLNDTAQGQHSLKGRVLSGGKAVEFATIFLPDSGKGAVSEADGHFQIFGLQKGRLKVEVSLLGFRRYITEVEIPYEGDMIVEMESLDSSLDEVVVSGTLQEVSRLNSPVPVEVIRRAFLKPIQPHPYLNPYRILTE